MAIYTEELFATGNDDDNRAAVRAVRPRSSIRRRRRVRSRSEVDKVVKGLSLHA